MAPNQYAKPLPLCCLSFIFLFFGSQDLKIRIFEAGCWVSASVMTVCRRQRQEDLDSRGKLNCMFQKEKDKQPKHEAREEERKEEEKKKEQGRRGERRRHYSPGVRDYAEGQLPPTVCN